MARTKQIARKSRDHRRNDPNWSLTDKQRQKAQNKYNRRAEFYAYSILEPSIHLLVEALRHTHGQEHDSTTYHLLSRHGATLAEQLLNDQHLVDFFAKAPPSDHVRAVQKRVFQAFIESEEYCQDAEKLHRTAIQIPVSEIAAAGKAQQEWYNLHHTNQKRRVFITKVFAMVYGVEPGCVETGTLRLALDNAAQEVKPLIREFKLREKAPSMSNLEWQGFKKRSKHLGETEGENEM